jgi:hypothetical protein
LIHAFLGFPHGQPFVPDHPGPGVPLDQRSRFIERVERLVDGAIPHHEVRHLALPDLA